ncbi:gamma-glutamyltransferase [Pelosinus sp. IPA-1]|uniref:gamma-glutamyltransferase n=1 Tax=Pelosinus sp. IPA-1 TaxID=3029569 RepID=UPI0024362960|nr:gamma-glutamyltransferase [Pelosinus sp. IPA-1]GMB02161.1 gamma-glutamyltransferase [Pelosinus sp. IPA-1]
MRFVSKSVAVICVLSLLITLMTPLNGIVQAASARPDKSSVGMVMSTQKIANDIGMQVLKDGGNAIDAAVAVGYALAVVHPVAGNIGGGGFAVIHTVAGDNVTLDFREVAPGKATRDMYLDKDGNVIPNASVEGYLAAGVPGTVAGLSAMLNRYGSKSLATLIQPAINYAENGFNVTARQAETFNEYAPRLTKFASSKQYFLKSDGSNYKEGEVLIQKDLAKTLRLIAQKGPDAFYKGEIAELIAKDMAANRGIITKEDLAKYKPIWREPVKGTYRGYDIISMSPPSSGGTHIVQILNVLEGFDLKSMGYGSSQAVHVLAEAMRYAYADRSEFMGDPDFTKIPLKGLTSKDYAAEIRSKIDMNKATPSADVKPGQPAMHEGTNTTHYSIVDKWGNAVSITYTINDYYGSGAAVKGAGFLLNNEMDDFSIKPGVANIYGLVGGDANAIEPYKRPLSSMSPTIILKDGKLFMVVGSPGGSRIITTVQQVISNVIDYDMNIREAVDAPRVHMQWQPDELRIEKNGLVKDVVDNLTVMGYKVVTRGNMGDVNAILIDPSSGIMYGSGDPRNEF